MRHGEMFEKIYHGHVDIHGQHGEMSGNTRRRRKAGRAAWVGNE
jgi:hypothetical protein